MFTFGCRKLVPLGNNVLLMMLAGIGLLLLAEEMAMEGSLQERVLQLVIN